MKKVGLLFGAILVTLVFAELALRVTGLGVIRPAMQFGEFTGGQVDEGVLVTDPDLFWREPAGPPDERHHGTHVVRIGDPIPAKTSRLRIMVVGDSCTRISTSNRPYSVVLQEAFEGRAEVFNASLPGYTSHQGLAWLRKQLLDYEPDLVVIYFGWNDHWRSWGLADSDYAARLSSGLRLVRLFQGLPDEPPLRLTVDEYRANLTAMVDEIQAAGGTSMMVLAPHHLMAEVLPRFLANGTIVRGDDPNALHTTYLEVAREVGSRSGVRLYDAAAQFTAMNEPQLMLMRDGIHPTDPGHVVLARTMADDIMRHEFQAPFPPIDPAALGFAFLAQDMSARMRWLDSARFFRSAISLEPEDMGTRQGLAWLLSTCPVDSVRNGAEALEILAPGLEGGGRNVRYLDVRATALAELGRFDEAVAEADRALALLESLGQAAGPYGQDLKARRNAIAAGIPYRIEVPTGR